MGYFKTVDVLLFGCRWCESTKHYAIDQWFPNLFEPIPKSS